MKVDVLNQQGKKVGQVELNPQIFEAQINLPLMAQAVRVYLANQRRGTHKTKTRGEVSGGGRKPWPQKRTGRARHGSRRSPLWVGGGHTKAKKPRDYRLKLPRKMKRKALLSALSAQLRDEKIIVVDKIKFKEASTAKASEILGKLGLTQKPLLIFPQKDELLVKSFRNLPGMRTKEASSLNTYDVLNCEKLIILKEALKVLEEAFLR